MEFSYGARTGWVTERIASARSRSESIDRKTKFEWCLGMAARSTFEPVGKVETEGIEKVLSHG